MSGKRMEKRSQVQKNLNYKNLISQYYDRDTHLSDVHDEVKLITPEIQILDELNQFQKKIDGLIKTKRYDVQELYMKPSQKIKRLVRVYLKRDQGVVKMYGHLHPKKEDTAHLKFTSFFRQFQLMCEKEKNIVETWKKPTSNFIERDGVIFKLPANTEEISIFLTLIYNPPKFEVDPQLERIVGISRGTRVEVLEAFWLYVKTKKLQDMENKEVINADDFIRQAFKTEKLTFATVNNRVRELLIPVDPFKITLDHGQNQKCFDIIVDVEEKPDIDIVPFFSQKLNEEKNDHPFLSMMGKIKKYQLKTREHTEKLRRHLKKREIYKNFKPETIESIIVEQQTLLAELQKSDPVEEHNKLEFILENQDEVEKEIKHYFEHLSSNTINGFKQD